MDNKISLYQEYRNLSKYNKINDIIPKHITSNLNPVFKLREYQNLAFSYFIFHNQNILNGQIKLFPQRHLLFHMATGSGKTLIMAGVILHLYKLGYRNFIFFVQSTNIIKKTKDNFLKKNSSKYLFNEHINIDGKLIKINEVVNFSYQKTNNKDDINIIFTTTQGLHSNIKNPSENSLTYESFEDHKVVFLADEAHHINADTRESKREKEQRLTWESTIAKIFKANSENFLLEFTATAELEHPDINKKYFDKLIFDYPLKSFREDKYSKDVKLLQADISPIDRSLLAIIISQLRRKIFEKNGKKIKPVILFKSRTIQESIDFLEKFSLTIKNITSDKIKKLLDKSSSDIILKANKYFNENNISLENLALELREEFSSNKCISVNSKNDSEQKQIIINNLEDKDNEFRAIFAVDQLNEGWDVLNLFDIVRLYNTRDADHKTGKIGKTTMQEAQLIGRGARYCPFKIEKNHDKFKRKYDDDIDNELRICEELYYHAAHNPKYISELNQALTKIGIKPTQEVLKKLFLKDDFIQTNFYLNDKIYLNKKIKNDKSENNIFMKELRNKVFKKSLKSGQINLSSAFSKNSSVDRTKVLEKKFFIRDFGKHLIRKSLDKVIFFHFSNLKSYFPSLKSIEEFITSDNYLNKISVEVSSEEQRIKNLTKIDENLSYDYIIQAQNDKKNILISILNEISSLIVSNSVDFVGTNDFFGKKISDVFDKIKILKFSINDTGSQEFGVGQGETTNSQLNMDLSFKKWYVFNENYGTDQEKFLVKFIDMLYRDELKDKFDDIYLIRNEKHFKVFTFNEGLSFEPDFVLFLKKINGNKSTLYQIFIEPKGENLISNDDSNKKQLFLEKINDQSNIISNDKNTNIKLFGTVLFNEFLSKENFMNQINKIIN